MANINNIKTKLEEIAENQPELVIAKLTNGDLVNKSMGLIYEIDDQNIDRKLGTFPKGLIPYSLIYKKLRSQRSEIQRLFDNSTTIPFSKAYEAGVGESLEKAILVQLSAQRGRTAFLINGFLEEDGEVGAMPQAFNIVFKGDNAFLLDLHNSSIDLYSTNTHTRPYIAPILNIDEEYGTFIVPNDWKQRRTYSLHQNDLS